MNHTSKVLLLSCIVVAAWSCGGGAASTSGAGGGSGAGGQGGSVEDASSNVDAGDAGGNSGSPTGGGGAGGTAGSAGTSGGSGDASTETGPRDGSQPNDAATAAPDARADAVVVDRAAADAPGPSCGSRTCAAGEYCCNLSCGMCARIGVLCIQIACTDASAD